MKEQSENGLKTGKRQEGIARDAAEKSDPVDRERDFQCGTLTHGISADLKKER
jgi:hypothetical protein